MQEVLFKDIGKVSYSNALEFQENLFNKIIDAKLINRNLPSHKQTHTKNYFIICEHPHVITQGKSGKGDNLLVSEIQLKEKGIEYFRTSRGGDVTYHGPGQIVGYPILDLDNFFTDIHKYMSFLEEVIIRTVKEYGVKEVGRAEGLTGVWIEPDNLKKTRKICALGVKTSRWVTMHGFAFNVSTDLNYYENIIPCGIQGKSVTSLENELQRKIDINEVKQKVKTQFEKVFQVCLEPF